VPDKKCESGSARQKRASLKGFCAYQVYQTFFNKKNNISGGTFPPSKKEKQK
jgi:hypothetical protein